ncbi:hypothetical protein BpHYR1_008749, partial [Brachionus plicatilis]
MLNSFTKLPIFFNEDKISQSNNLKIKNKKRVIMTYKIVQPMSAIKCLRISVFQPLYRQVQLHDLVQDVSNPNRHNLMESYKPSLESSPFFNSIRNEKGNILFKGYNSTRCDNYKLRRLVHKYGLILFCSMPNFNIEVETRVDCNPK